MSIHPTALVDSSAELGKNVDVGPYTIIGPKVTIGNDSIIGSHCVVENRTTIGSGVKIFKGAVIGSIPQDLKYGGEDAELIVGDTTTIREFVTLNIGTVDRMKTSIGCECLIMAYAHVAHDCSIGDNVIIANAVNMGGHVSIEHYAIVGGLTAIHQFTRIGRHCIIGGGFRAVQDVPPYVKAAGEPLRYCGVNTEGLGRRNFSIDVMNNIKQAYRILYRSKLKQKDALEKIKNDISQCEEVNVVVDFVKNSKRGLI